MQTSVPYSRQLTEFKKSVYMCFIFCYLKHFLFIFVTQKSSFMTEKCLLLLFLTILPNLSVPDLPHPTAYLNISMSRPIFFLDWNTDEHFICVSIYG